MKLRVGITGARGFLGIHIARAISKRGGAAVSGCDLPRCDLLDPRAAARFVKGKDVIVHAAAINRGSDAEVIAGSVVSTWNLAAAASRLTRKPKIIFLSSTQAEMETLYGVSKKLCEVMLEDIAKQKRLPVTVFRLANVFGEGGRPFYNSVIATFCHQIARGKKLTVASSPKKFAFVYAGDAASLVAREAYAKRTARFRLVRVASANQLSIPKLSKLLLKLSRRKSADGLRSKFEKDLYRVYRSYIPK